MQIIVFRFRTRYGLNTKPVRIRYNTGIYVRTRYVSVYAFPWYRLGTMPSCMTDVPDAAYRVRNGFLFIPRLIPRLIP